jgi:hypothetical protein
LTKVSKKDLGRCFKQIKHLLTTPEDGEVSYESHVYRVASQLDMNQMIISPTLKVVDFNLVDEESQGFGDTGWQIPYYCGCCMFVLCKLFKSITYIGKTNSRSSTLH